MKSSFILEAFNLKSIYGWELNALSTNSENFYEGILENNSICLSWIAFKKNISPEDLKIHHFKRNGSEMPGIENSLPCFLIVTSGKKWFVSKINDGEFTEINLAGLIDLISEGLKQLLAILKFKKGDVQLIDNIHRSLNYMNQQSTLIGSENEGIVSKKNSAHENYNVSLITSEQKKENALKELFIGKRESISQLLDHKINEAYASSLVLHQILVRNYSHRQILALLEIKTTSNIYVELVQMQSDLIYCETLFDINTMMPRLRNIELKYYKINTSGETNKYITKSELEKKNLKKGLFCINKHTLSKLVNLK